MYKSSPLYDKTMSGSVRFMGAAGTKMPDSPVGERRCGSHITTWVAGGHPSEEDFQKEVTRTIHLQWNGGYSYKTVEAKIMIFSTISTGIFEPSRRPTGG